MSTPTFARRENLEVIEEYYRRWVADPASVDDRWQAFFEGFELAGAGSGPAGASGDTSQTSVVRLIMNYRNIGHLQAHLDDPARDRGDLGLVGQHDPAAGRRPALVLANQHPHPERLDELCHREVLLRRPAETTR